MMAILENLADISLEAAPWLLLGFLCAGLIKAWLPADLINRWLGGDGVWPVTKAALIGAPLPLCSCGVLPAATSLRRNGASRSSTVSFLIATPETGVDSLALSYALLGPVMALIRPVAAIGSAIFTGLLTLLFGAERARAQAPADGDMLAVFEESCGDNQCSDKRCTTPPVTRQGLISRTLDGLRYGLVDMVDDLVLWLAFGLLLAALMQTFAPPMLLADWGSGLPAMLLMLLVDSYLHLRHRLHAHRRSAADRRRLAGHGAGVSAGRTGHQYRHHGRDPSGNGNQGADRLSDRHRCQQRRFRSAHRCPAAGLRHRCPCPGQRRP